MKSLHTVAFILLIIGGLNWGLTALVGHDVVAGFLGGTISMIVYVLVGLSAIYEVATHKTNCRHCNPSGASM